MYIPKNPHTKIVRDTIHYYLEHGSIQDLKIGGLPKELYETQRGCFVSLHKTNDDLRGCIGTIEPHEKNLVEEIKRNALSAAFHDYRFAPLEEKELETLTYSVDVLTVPEKIESADDLDPQIFGLIITDGKNKRGILLPSIPGITTVDQQISIVKRKAGLGRADDRGLEFYRFTSNRYD